MDCGTLIFVGTVVALVAWGAWLIRGILASNRRADELPRDLQELGARHGLAFAARGEDEAEPLVAETTFAARFAEPRYRVGGAMDALQVDVVGVIWKRGFRTSQVRTQLAVVFSAPVARWPRFVLADEWASESPTELGITDLVEVELPLGEDLEAWTLWARSADEVRAFLTPRLLATLGALAKAGRGLVVEAFPNRLVLWREEARWQRDAFEPLLADARQVRAVCDEAVSAPATGSAARCPRCGAVLTPTNRFCGACGTAVAIT